MFRLTVLAISFSVVMFSSSYMAEDNNYKYFLIVLMSFVFSINVLIFVPNLISLLIGWDGLGLSSYLLVAYYQNDIRLGRAIITALTNRLGDRFLMMAVVLCYPLIRFRVFNMKMITFLFIILFISASFTKRAQTPFSA